MAQTVNNDIKTWRQIKFGAGGFLTGLTQAYDGTLYCRNDTSGAHKWNTSTSSWDQLVTTTSMPAGDIHTDFGGGTFEVMAAPGSADSSIVYMLYGAGGFEFFPYRSADKGATWVKRTGNVTNPFGTAGNYGAAGIDANNQANGARLTQKLIAVDPSNPDVVYACNGTTLKKTTNGGVDWSSCTGFVAPGVFDLPVTGILIDPSSSTLSSPTRKAVIWAFSNGNCYFRSTDGGNNWAAMQGGPAKYGNITGISKATSAVVDIVGHPFSNGDQISFRNVSGMSEINGRTGIVTATTANTITVGINSTAFSTYTSGGVAYVAGYVRDAAINSNGVLLAVDSATGKTWRNSSGVWTDLGGTNAWFVAFDPNSVNRAVIASADSQLKEQTNVTTGDFSGSWLNGTANKVSPEIPWHAVAIEEEYMSCGGIAFSKSTANRLYNAQGIGFWRTDISPGFTSSHTWTSMSAGIEQLTSNQVKKFTGNRYLYYACWDRGMFRTANPEAYPPYANTPASSLANDGIRHVFHIDSAKDDSDFIVALVTYGNAYAGCSYSTDAGDTWTMFERPPIPGGDKGGFNILSVTNGSPTVTVNETAHGLTNGWYVPIHRCDTIGGITPAGKVQVTVVNANQWTFTHGSNATSSVSNAGGNFRYCVDYFNSAWQQPAVSNAINTTSGSPNVTIQLDNRGDGGALRAGGWINIYGASTVGGLTVNGRQRITAFSNGLVTFQPGGNASSTVTGGGGTNVCWMTEWMYPRVPQNSQIAVSTSTNWVLIAAAGRGIFYTTNGGANPTWTRCSFPSVVNDFGWDINYASYRSIVVADPNTANKFYLFHYANGTYVSTDGGANWTLQSSNTLQSGNFHTKLRCVPGFSGHLFWASGQIGTYNDYSNPVAKNYFSTNGGATWTEIGALTLGTASTGEIVEFYDLSIGAIKPGKTYPTIWAVGFIDAGAGKTYGIYYCVDADPTTTGKWTWYKAGDWPLGQIDTVRALWADPDQWDTCYGAFYGGGCFYTAADTTTKAFKITT